MTLAHHDAAERDERRGCKAEFLGPEERGDGNVAAGLQLSVRLQHHARAQVVHHERLVRFGDAELPWHAGVLDRRQRRRTGAAGVAGDHEVIGARLRNAGCDGAHADLGAELHADPRVRIRVLQVVNQLRDVFDRIDVVMRRRADQADARRRMPNAGDVFVDLASGQFAAFTGLRALHDLDLQLVGVRQIVDRDAEPAAGDLFDRGALRVAVRQRNEADRIFAAFAGVRLAADAVHRDGERFVRLLRDRAEAHRAGDEAPDDLLLRLDFLDRHRTIVDVRVERDQAAQHRVAGGFLCSCASRIASTRLRCWCARRPAVPRSQSDPTCGDRRLCANGNRPDSAAPAARPRRGPDSRAACRRCSSSTSMSKPTPCTRLAVPAKQRSITSSARPIASKICAPL